MADRRRERIAMGAAALAPLFALERENELAARRQAEEQLRSAEARLANLKTRKRAPEVEAVSGQFRQAIAARDLSTTGLKRQESLFASGFVSSATLD
jgi:HlyD family secretion protein